MYKTIKFRPTRFQSYLVNAQETYKLGRNTGCTCVRVVSTLTTCHRRACGEHRNPMAEATGEDRSGEGSGPGPGDRTAQSQRPGPQKRSRGQPASGGRTQPSKNLEEERGGEQIQGRGVGSHPWCSENPPRKPATQTKSAGWMGPVGFQCGTPEKRFSIWETGAC